MEFTFQVKRKLLTFSLSKLSTPSLISNFSQCGSHPYGQLYNFTPWVGKMFHFCCNSRFRIDQMVKNFQKQIFLKFSSVKYISHSVRKLGLRLVTNTILRIWMHLLFQDLCGDIGFGPIPMCVASDHLMYLHTPVATHLFCTNFLPRVYGVSID